MTNAVNRAIVAKRRFFLLVSVVTLFVASLYAAPVDPMRAINVVEQFMPSQPVPKKNAKGQTAAPQTSQIVYTHYMPNSGRPAIYVVNIGNGFALVSADDVAHPVLGYNYGKAWPTDGQPLPLSVKGFLDDLAAQMEAASTHPQDNEIAAEWQQPRRSPNRTPKHTPSSLPDSVGPLLTTTWDQGHYYNALCPEDGQSPYDGHVLTGCVATAMAQIIKYWGYPIHGRGSHSYNTSGIDQGSIDAEVIDYGTQFVDFSGSTYAYEHMPNMLTAGSSQEEINAVAQLMYHCGVAVNMLYGPSASGAQNEDVRAALISYFGFAPSMGYANRRLYSDQVWEDSLRANINRGEPIYYTGANVFGAHAFVCDGYKQDGYFHFNFGWSGSADGWYLTKVVNPGWSYNEWQSAIMGIRPDTSMQMIICHRVLAVQSMDTFMVDHPVDLCPLRENSDYFAVNEMTGTKITLTLLPKDSQEQLEMDVIEFGQEQSVVIYDGINKDSILRVIETRNLDDNTTMTYKTWLYDGLDSDTIFQNLAGTDFSPMVSSRHGFTIVTYSYGGTAEGFRLRVRNALDTTSIDTIVSNKLYWTDVVTTEPQGYVLENDTIKVYSAEGLAWLSRHLDSLYVNRALDGELYQYNHYTISIENDIDLGGYLWRPIRHWLGNIEGNGHEVKNMNVSTSGKGGLFSALFYGQVSNLGIIKARINAISESGAIAGVIQKSEIKNCYSKEHIISSGNGKAGGLFGSASGKSQVINCYAYGDVYAQFSYGGAIGYFDDSEMHNCVTQLGEKENWYYMYFNSLLTGEVYSGTFTNCFSDISLAKRDWGSGDPEYVALAKRAYFLGDVHAVDNIENLAAFNIAQDTIGALIADTAVNYTLGDMDVITALNNKVAEYNSSEYRTWIRDSVTHLPIFGDLYEVTCPNISDIIADNIPYNDDFAVAISWQENGDAHEWQVKYKIKNAPGDDATIYLTNSTHDTISGLLLGNEYSFYIRPLCGGEDTVGWGKPFNFYVDKTLWVDIVDERPSGYIENNGNVYIYSSEALAWLANNWGYGSEDTIFIMSDLDMGAYRWTPIGKYDFRGVIEGNNHIISNLYCSENLNDNNVEHIGLTGQAHNASYRNVIIKNSTFRGNHCVGSLFGLAWNSIVNNCHAIDVNVTGLYVVGGLGGGLWSDGGVCQTYNSSASGDINGDQGVGGLYASKSGELINCYSRCNVLPLGIRNERSYEGRGGLLGRVGGMTINCYSASIIGAHKNDYKNVVGSAAGIFGNGELHNIYAKSLDSIPFVGSLEDNYLFTDTASMVNTTLQTAITIAETEYTDLLSALNAWVDANNENGKYRHWVADTENVNGGFPIFDPNDTPSTGIDNINTNVNAVKILYNGQIYILRCDRLYTIQGQEVK